MLTSTRLAQEAAEISLRINELGQDIETRSAANPDDSEIETRVAERQSKQAELIEKQKAQIEAMKQEDNEAQAAMVRNVDDSGFSAELKEFRALAQSTDVAKYVLAAAQGTEIREGAEAEYNKHVFGHWAIGDYPLEMLLQANEFDELPASVYRALSGDDVEQRALIGGTSSSAQNNSYLARLLADSEGTWLRADYRSVGPGRHTYPIVSGSTVAGTIARGTAETAGGSITTEDADAERIQHSYEVAAVDELHMPGIGAYLASDLRQSLMSGLDNKIVDDLRTKMGAPDTAFDTAGTTITLNAFLGFHGAVVNGIGAVDASQVRWLLGGVPEAAMNNSSYAVLFALAAASTSDLVHRMFFGPNPIVRASAHIAATSAGDEQDNFAIRMAPAPPRLIVPVWRRGQLLRDTGRLQLSGDITLTGVMYADVILAAEDLHVGVRFDTA